MTTVDFINNSKKIRDRKFVARVKEYVKNCFHQPSILEIAEHLQVTFPLDYGRRKRQALMQYVKLVLQYLDRSADTEEKYSVRQQKITHSIYEDEDDKRGIGSNSMEFDEELVNYKDSNIINNTMKKLYKNAANNNAPSTAIIDLTSESFVNSKATLSPRLSASSLQRNLDLPSPSKRSRFSSPNGKDMQNGPHSPTQQCLHSPRQHASLQSHKQHSPQSPQQSSLHSPLQYGLQSPKQQTSEISQERNHAQELPCLSTRVQKSILSEDLHKKHTPYNNYSLLQPVGNTGGESLEKSVSFAVSHSPSSIAAVATSPKDKDCALISKSSHDSPESQDNVLKESFLSSIHCTEVSGKTLEDPEMTPHHGKSSHSSVLDAKVNSRAVNLANQSSHSMNASSAISFEVTHLVENGSDIQADSLISSSTQSATNETFIQTDKVISFTEASSYLTPLVNGNVESSIKGNVGSSTSTSLKLNLQPDIAPAGNQNFDANVEEKVSMQSLSSSSTVPKYEDASHSQTSMDSEKSNSSLIYNTVERKVASRPSISKSCLEMEENNIQQLQVTTGSALSSEGQSTITRIVNNNFSSDVEGEISTQVENKLPHSSNKINSTITPPAHFDVIPIAHKVPTSEVENKLSHSSNKTNSTITPPAHFDVIPIAHEVPTSEVEDKLPTSPLTSRSSPMKKIEILTPQCPMDFTILSLQDQSNVVVAMESLLSETKQKKSILSKFDDTLITSDMLPPEEEKETSMSIHSAISEENLSTLPLSSTTHVEDMETDQPLSLVNQVISSREKAVLRENGMNISKENSNTSTDKNHMCEEDNGNSESKPSDTRKGKTLKKRSKNKVFDSDEHLKENKRFQSTISETTFKDIGGYESCIEEVSKLLLHLKHPEVFSQMGIKIPRGFLLHGPPGCGKTLLANAIAGELKLPFIRIAATEIVSGISGDSEERIRTLFAEAMSCAPSILFIDEIDSIAQKRENAGKDMERRIVTQIISCMDELQKSGSHVLVIGASNRPDSLDPSLRRAGRFDRELAMGIPDRASRKAILKVICKDLRLSPNFDFERIAAKTPGFVGVDMQALSWEAGICALESAFRLLKNSAIGDTRNKENSISEESCRLYKVIEMVADTDMPMSLGITKKPIENIGRPSKTIGEDSSIKESNVTAWLNDQPPLTPEQLSMLYITTEHFEKALPSVQPCAKREGFATVPDVSWDDIGALEDIRDELEMAIMAPVENPSEFESFGLTTPPGILLVGPPGCGKTLLAKAIANEAGINFISVKGPELLNMYVGESEKAVRQVFERARTSSPCVIFFDEIDALCPKRSETGDSNVTSRVVNQLLTEMDGLQKRKQVFIMGATNRPDILDGAILRPGRIDRKLYVGLPNAEDREKILNTITKRGTKPTFSDDITVKDLAFDQRLNGFSGADLGAVVREASVCALKDFRKQLKDTNEVCIELEGFIPSSSQSAVESDYNHSRYSDSQPTAESTKALIRKRHFDAALTKVKPSVTPKDRLWYEKMKLDTGR